MLYTHLKEKLLKSNTFKSALLDTSSGNDIYIKGLAGSLKSLFLSLLFEKNNSSLLYITGDDEQEELIREDIEMLLGADKVAYFPRYKEIAYDGGIVDSSRKNQMILALEKLLDTKKLFVITSAKNLTQKYYSSEWIKKQKLLLKEASEFKFDFLKERLIELGFNREAVVESWGEVSVRGGIVDIYPFSSDYPYRIEFFGDNIESIRMFDPITQRSIQSMKQLVIYPQHPDEIEDAEDVSLVSLFDYFDKEAILFFDEIEMIKKEIDEFFSASKISSKKKTLNTDHIIKESLFLKWNQLEDIFKKFRQITLDSFVKVNRGIVYDFNAKSQESLRGNLKLLKRKIEQLSYSEKKEVHNDIYFLCDTAGQVDRVEEILLEEEVDCNKINIELFGLNQGFIFNEIGLVVFTDNQFYGRSLRWRKKKKISRGLTMQQLNSLSLDDYVVHIDKGIGQYKGLKIITVNKNERECLSIAYRDDDFLYVPLDKMNRVQKYSAKEGVIPVLSKIGSKDWDKLKKKTKKHIKDIASDLIKLYAKRKSLKGYAFSKDTLWQKELEASFEYQDTPDQAKATDDIKKDMENSYPMDRLICGDVGYGKTEVALRAAFKAVNDSKQVVVLVPTTILALQHYDLFRNRLRNYPIEIEMLSRFRTKSEQKKIVEMLKDGKVDIVIGTHRLLSKDVELKDVGLLIVDEEHRFGVKKKERLKEIQANVDILSMSATPIPRTLNMALLGIRDMSLINTPPQNRRPIHTEVVPFDNDLIRLAILKEVERGGQVFFVHNRVQSIDSTASLLRKIVPEVSIVVAHGQMDSKKLEKVMWDFASHKYQCLISTMIIESGLDIPNVNTLIVNRADRFGLSQLYQLRGRVGRSDHLAYAYSLVPPFHLLNRNALKRMRIIEEFTDLGAGFKIAMQDLQIRGAGNILGAQQSGKIVALGYELYTKIIEEAVQELKLEQEGKEVPESLEKEETKVDINKDAFIPDDYIEQSELKVDIYRRLAGEKDLNIIHQIKEVLIDRFGILPESVINLFYLVELKNIGNFLGLRSLKITEKKVIAYFSDEIVLLSRELKEKKICSIMEKAKGSFHFVQDKNSGLGIHVNIPDNELDYIGYSKIFLEKLI